MTSRVINTDDGGDLFATNGTEIVSVLQRFRALAARDHVMTRTQQRVTCPIHANGALVIESAT